MSQRNKTTPKGKETTDQKYRLRLRLPPGHDTRPQFLGFSLGFGYALVEGGPWCARPLVRILANIREPLPRVFTEYSDDEFRAELAIDAWNTLLEGNEDWKQYEAEYPNGLQDAMTHLAGHDGYEIERCDAKADRWVPVSQWRLDELRRAEDWARASAQFGAAATEGTAPTPEGSRNRRGAPSHLTLTPEELEAVKIANEWRRLGRSWPKVEERTGSTRKTLLKWAKLAPIGEDIHLSSP